MADHSRKNIEAYGRNAATLAQSYNAVSTPDAVPGFAQTLSAYADKGRYWALDIGCGTGRDAAWMAVQGFNVVAIDGTADMLAQAQREKSHKHIMYLQDTAPELSWTKALGLRFDVILMSAFLFHLDARERQDFYGHLKDLIKDDSYIYMTLRHGPVPEGRRMFTVPLEELRIFAAENDLRFKNLGRQGDVLGRADVSWDHVELKKPPRLIR